MTNISEDFRLYKTTKKLDSKEKLILEKNKRFFSYNRKYIDSMLTIINGESCISIRLLDWFISNYAKKNNTSYTIKNTDIKSQFCVYTEYKNQLNSCSKDYFDPFCRRRKLLYAYKDRNRKNRIVFKSSIGQLNFFQWAIRNRVIMYVQNHLKEIDSDMKRTTRENKKAKEMMESSPPPNKYSGSKKSHIDNNDSESETDPIICSSDNVNNICITPKKKIVSESDSENKYKRRQLSKSVYDYGIIKNNKTIRLDFD